MSNRVSVKVSGVNEAVNRLKSRIMSYPNYFSAVIKTETQDAANVAQGYFGGAASCVAGPVTQESSMIRGSVEANGDAVVFLEFGAGNATGHGEHGDEIITFEMNSGIKVAPGSYSEAHSRMYVENGFWVFGGKTYTQITPVRGMYQAAQKMKADLANSQSAAYTSNESVLGK